MISYFYFTFFYFYIYFTANFSYFYCTAVCNRGGMLFRTSIWGPTCDGLDKILEDVELPELEDGDWIFFKDMGSYTLAAGSCFNGIPKPRVYYIAEVNLPG